MDIEKIGEVYERICLSIEQDMSGSNTEGIERKVFEEFGLVAYKKRNGEITIQRFNGQEQINEKASITIGSNNIFLDIGKEAIIGYKNEDKPIHAGGHIYISSDGDFEIHVQDIEIEPTIGENVSIEKCFEKIIQQLQENIERKKQLIDIVNSLPTGYKSEEIKQISQIYSMRLAWGKLSELYDSFNRLAQSELEKKKKEEISKAVQLLLLPGSMEKISTAFLDVIVVKAQNELLSRKELIGQIEGNLGQNRNLWNFDNCKL